MVTVDARRDHAIRGKEHAISRPSAGIS
jgi:hypothetical protein